MLRKMFDVGASVDIQIKKGKPDEIKKFNGRRTMISKVLSTNVNMRNYEVFVEGERLHLFHHEVKKVK